MRSLIRRKLLPLLSVLLISVAFTSCENPFDPLDTSEEIRGLSYIDYTLLWAFWDSDPEGDGVEVEVAYFNEFGDSLSFHDKNHRVVIEFYTQQTVGAIVDPENPDAPPSGGIPASDQLFFTFPVEHSNSDNTIRIPIEAYEGSMVEAGYDFTGCVTGEDPETGAPPDFNAFVQVRVFPPQQKPQAELVIYYADQLIYECPETLPPDETAGEGGGTGL